MKRTECPHCGLTIQNMVTAERLAAAVNLLVKHAKIDARSLAADVLLDYYQGDGPAPVVPTAKESWDLLKREGE